MNTGDIRDPAYAKMTRIYAFNELKKCLPRQCSPSDFDGFYHISSKERGSFLWFEFKTEGELMSGAQRQDAKDLLFRGRPLDALILAWHPNLRNVEVPKGITEYAVFRHVYQTRKVECTDNLPGETLTSCCQKWFDYVEGKDMSFVNDFHRDAKLPPPEAITPTDIKWGDWKNM